MLIKKKIIRLQFNSIQLNSIKINFKTKLVTDSVFQWIRIEAVYAIIKIVHRCNLT